ncbi:thermonuclease family protein [Bradyrhizobium sp. CCBAU 11357]|uniref:thermonuclease family protein n=1 Tax=Bradyrhizobium sp. CCBAU 11357 TaxID=1630808 RepID=UPI00230232E3|nr:thermonuclease family protein [Bradyrhizobium sp. CCBAU 11357]
MDSRLLGQTSVIDGDTIEIRGSRIRLWGIDAPEHDQLCRGEDSIEYRCGAKAANALDQLIGARTVSCLTIDTDRYGRAVAKCSVGGVDLAKWLVAQGHALDWPRYSKGEYNQEQKQAEKAGIGIWAGSFVEPWRYRNCLRAGRSSIACSDDQRANAKPD